MLGFRTLTYELVRVQNSTHYKFFFFLCFWLCWVFVTVWTLVVKIGGYSLDAGLRLLIVAASLVEHGL